MERTDIFHFSGHGEFTTEPEPTFGNQPGEGAIILAGEGDEALPVSANRLGEVLRGRGVRLVVLGACETGRRDGKNVWSGVAASLLKAGIPAVVAMQFTIQDTLAAVFSEAFYRALVAGFIIDEAVAAGRAAMRAEALNGQHDIRDWGVPVLYLRAPGGRVFNAVSDVQAQQAAEKKLTQLFEQHLRTVPSTGRVIGAVAGTMQAGTITVDETIAERVSGVVIGNYTVSFQGGQLIVRHQADVVDGVLIGGFFGTIGGSSSPDVSQEQALAKLQELLHMEVPGTPASPKYCARCGAELPAGGRFCTRCGTPAGSP
jgi:CHAT domain